MLHFMKDRHKVLFLDQSVQSQGQCNYEHKSSQKANGKSMFKGFVELEIAFLFSNNFYSIPCSTVSHASFYERQAQSPFFQTGRFSHRASAIMSINPPRERTLRDGRVFGHKRLQRWARMQIHLLQPLYRSQFCQLCSGAVLYIRVPKLVRFSVDLDWFLVGLRSDFGRFTFLANFG